MSLSTKKTMLDYPLEDILLPMGAKEVKDESKMEALWDDKNYIAEEKYDGSRYLSVGGRFFSRRVSEVTHFPVEKTGNVPHLVAVLQKYPNLILDGEVYYEGMSSNDVTSIMGALPDKAIERQGERGWLKYVVFDILRDFNGNWLMDRSWDERREALAATLTYILKEHPECKDIEISRVTYDDKRGLYNKIMARGGEGVILKNRKAKYIPEKKPAWNWVKVKKHITDDVVIMGFKPPVREYEGKELDSWQYWENLDKGFEGRIVEVKTNASTEEVINYEGDKLVVPVAATNIYGLDGDGIVRYVRVFGNKPNVGFEPVTKFYFYNWIGAVTFGKWADVYTDLEGDERRPDEVQSLYGKLIEAGYDTSYDVFLTKFTHEYKLVELGYCSGLTDEMRKDMSENPDKYIGGCMEIGAMEQTKDGFYRHPQFSRMRPDKNPSDCVIGED